MTEHLPVKGVVPPGSLYLCIHAGDDGPTLTAFKERALGLGGVQFQERVWLLAIVGPASRLIELFADAGCMLSPILVLDVNDPNDLAMNGADVRALSSYLTAVRGW